MTPVLSKARPCGLSSPEATTLTFFADLYAVTVPAYSSQTKSSPFGWKARSTGTFNPGMYVVTDPFGETRATRLAPVSATYRSPEASNARSWGAENPLAKRFTLPSGVILTMVPPDCSTAKRSPDGLKISPRGPASPVANTVYPIPETGWISEPASQRGAQAMTKVTRIRIDSPRKTAAGKIRRPAGNTCLVMTPSFTPVESGSDRKTNPWDSRFPVDRRLTVTGIFLLRFRGEQIGSPPTDVFPDKPNKISFEPEISQSARFYEKRDSGGKPKSL